MKNLRFLGIFTFCVFFAACNLAQTPAPSASQLPFTLKPLGHGVYTAIDDAKGDGGANAGFVIGDDGVAVIDTFERKAAAKALLAEIRKLTSLPIKFVVNTHYHLDHVAGNGVFQSAGAVVIAQRNVGGWIHTENLKFFGKNIRPEQKAEVEGLAAPDILFESRLELHLGARVLEVRFLRGHTGGDSVVEIPDAGVVFCGDLFWKRTLPNLIDATTSDWTTTLSTLTAFGPKRVFVPGHGDVGSEEDVAAFHSYLEDLRAWVAPQSKAGKSGDELVAAVMPELEKKYGDWNFFKYFAKRNILDMAAEIRGDKRIPEPTKK